MTIHYAREEVPEVLKFTPATATLGSAAAEADAAQAAMRPLAGFGAGAFTCDGALVGSGASELTLLRIRGAVAATSPAGAHGHGLGGAHQFGAVGISSVRKSGVRKSPVGIGSISISNVRTSTVRTSTVRTSTVGNGSVGTQQFDLMARINPAFPGGLGPHPAREPEPV